MSSPPVVSAGRAEFRAAVAEPVATKAAPRRSYRAGLTIASGGGGLLICFSVTLLLSATLLFLVQPMVGKMILPFLGGTPAVWTACMVFFQAMLLAGYAYAHLTTTRLGLGSQTALHALVLVVPLAVLPIVVRGGAAPPTEGNPTIWLLGCLLVSAGLPFFVVSATGPLLQRWFAMTPHPSAHDPYFLYAASNAGSLVALLGYPLLLEPYLPLADQSIVWAFGYAVLFILIAMSAILVVRCSAGVAGTHDTRLPQTEGRTQSSATRDVGLAERVEAITLRRRLWWVFAAAVPSSLMLGVTTHITTNLAPVPLLWVLPLAIYLLTFILVFARSRPIPHRWMVRLLPFLLPPAVAITFLDLPRMGWVAIVVHLATFFVAAMVCHGALSDRRPAAGRLTEFYLCLSIGGVLGGVFNAIVAPLVFRSIVEYPLAMVLACLFLPRRNGSAPEASGRRMDWLIPLGLAGVAATGLLILRAGAWGESLGLRLVVFGPMALACFALKDRPLRFALGMAVLMLTLGGYVALHRGTGLYAGRNFYGVKRVAVDGEGVFRVLTHGNTTHGKQFIDEARSDEPLTYYHRRGPLGDVFAAVRKTGRTASVGVIGLGAGSIACYTRPGESLTFYEIDPEVERIARDPRYFTFLARCRGDVNVVLGDGRLTLSRAVDHAYGLIVVDAFSSDSIPTHLLTREAIRLYLRKLKSDGVLAFHVSNRYLDLAPLLASLAADAGLVGRTRSDTRLSPEDKADGKTPAIYVVLARARGHLGQLARDERWNALRNTAGTPPWSDQYTSLLPFLRWR